MWASPSSGRGVAEILLGLGGNLGRPVETITEALERLDAGGIRITARSHWYRTAPWGVTDQPDFINLCAAGETALPPRALLDLALATEAALGRQRKDRWGPRAIDIDILAYGDQAIDEPGLQVPHPRLAERAFVLVPLMDIAPDRIIGGRSVRDMAGAIDASGVERIAPPL
jgi:2-amino-4-hydroxy-6-hydroxymethyldihydropteridine diphosphokinase